MSKRYTDTAKWDKTWFQDLDLKYKCFWFYILDRCDIAGIWDVNFKAATFFIGSEISKDEALKIFQDQIVEVNNKYWLIKDFIKFQNGWPLSEKSPVHKKITDTLFLKGITIKNNTLYDTLSNRVLYRVQVIVIVKEEVKETQGGAGGNIPGEDDHEKKMIEDLKEKCREMWRSVAWLENVAMSSGSTVEKVRSMIEIYCNEQIANVAFNKELKEYKRHFANWVRKKLQEQGTVIPIYRKELKPETEEERKSRELTSKKLQAMREESEKLPKKQGPLSAIIDQIASR